jgi:hypothetical protein
VVEQYSYDPESLLGVYQKQKTAEDRLSGRIHDDYSGPCVDDICSEVRPEKHWHCTDRWKIAVISEWEVL